MWTGGDRRADAGDRNDRSVWSLSEFLNLFDLRGNSWCIVEIHETGGFSLPPHDGVWFYSALMGRVRISGVAEGTLTLSQGEVRMILSGEAHAVRTEPGSPNYPLKFLREEQSVDCPPIFMIGQGPLVARLLCGRLHVTWPSGLRRKAMPSSLVIGDNLLGIDASMLRVESLQMMSRGAGASATLTRMAALMLSLALRAHPQCPLLFRLSAAENPIAHALQIIDADIAADWSIGRLASSVGMSRSSFAAHFAAQVGRPPMEVITEHRMHFASRLLQHTDLKLAEISERVGYQSETAFSRRFKQYFRLSPGQMRKMSKSRSFDGKVPDDPDLDPLRPLAWAEARRDH